MEELPSSAVIEEPCFVYDGKTMEEWEKKWAKQEEQILMRSASVPPFQFEGLTENEYLAKLQDEAERKADELFAPERITEKVSVIEKEIQEKLSKIEKLEAEQANPPPHLPDNPLYGLLGINLGPNPRELRDAGGMPYRIKTVGFVQTTAETRFFELKAELAELQPYAGIDYNTVGPAIRMVREAILALQNEFILLVLHRFKDPVDIFNELNEMVFVPEWVRNIMNNKWTWFLDRQTEIVSIKKEISGHRQRIKDIQMSASQDRSKYIENYIRSQNGNMMAAKKQHEDKIKIETKSIKDLEESLQKERATVVSKRELWVKAQAKKREREVIDKQHKLAVKIREFYEKKVANVELVADLRYYESTLKGIRDILYKSSYENNLYWQVKVLFDNDDSLTEKERAELLTESGVIPPPSPAVEMEEEEEDSCDCICHRKLSKHTCRCGDGEFATCYVHRKCTCNSFVYDDSNHRYCDNGGPAIRDGD